MRLPRKITNPRKFIPLPPVFDGCYLFTSKGEWIARSGEPAIPVDRMAILGGKFKWMDVHDTLGRVTTPGGFDYHHRYLLKWVFDHNKPLLVVMMLNPSKATHDTCDPTIHSLLDRAVKRGFGGVMVVNVYAYRATKPEELNYVSTYKAEGNWNFRYVAYAIRYAKRHGGTFVCGWGSHKNAMAAGRRLTLIPAMSIDMPLHAFDVNANGSPKHPLYIPRDKELVRWPLNP